MHSAAVIWHVISHNNHALLFSAFTDQFTFRSNTYPGYEVAQLVEALRYKPEGRGFDSRWCHRHNLSGRTVALRSTQSLTEMSIRNISWGAKAAGA